MTKKPRSTPAAFGDKDGQLFERGRHFGLHEKLGAHPGPAGGVTFSVWAPAAEDVSVVGDFNRWQPGRHPLHAGGATGVWTGHVDECAVGALYKFHIRSKLHDHTVDKADPFAFAAELPPATASRVAAPAHEWGDDVWMSGRRNRDAGHEPLSVYELHLGSWRRDAQGRHLDYAALADLLIPYLQQTGFTHVELLPLMEHPYYGSWGYQCTGYFAPTARYGEPGQLMRLIDGLHRAGIGVIFDWVPSHFPVDEHGLGFFDGTHLFEHADPRQGFHLDWGSYIFNYGSGHVRSFLISSALFWLERYHVDALRVDAVASMLYRDYSRPAGEWIPNKFGGRENLEAIDFLRQLNEAVHERFPGVLTIAEESTAWPMVSRPAHLGGLGFDMKWDMGWMHDTLEYMRLDPIHRKYHHDALTFRMTYAFSERFVLALSHDEVVHGKSALLGKMSGDEWQKFASLRALYGYMWGQPGKKLLFMGCEFGAWREWNHEGELQWSLVEHLPHAGMRRWVADLNALLRDVRALHELDFSPAGFRWVDCRDNDQSVIAFTRHAGDGSQILVICNFTPVPRHNYRVGVDLPGDWSERLNSDAGLYGGSGMGNLGRVASTPMRYHDRDHSLNLTLPPLSTLFLERAAPAPALAADGDAGDGDDEAETPEAT